MLKLFIKKRVDNVQKGKKTTKQITTSEQTVKNKSYLTYVKERNKPYLITI